MTALEVRNLTVSYNGIQAVDRLGLSVETGTWVSLIGPNGSGKTSVLRAIAGLVGTSGDIRILGDLQVSLSRKELSRRVAVVPQIPVVPGGMSVADYVLLGRTPYISYLGLESRQDFQIADAVLEQLDLTAVAGRPLTSLSGGELQRTILARALVQQSPLLLLDEPTTGLDIGHQQQVLELVDSLRNARGLTVLSAMHDLTLASQFAGELVLLRSGRAVASGPASSVLTESNIAHHYGASVRVEETGEGVAVVPVRPSSRLI